MTDIIPRKYNYNLETGTVGTDDDDMANILYNINRMEMKAGYDTNKLEDMQKSFGEAFFMAVDSNIHFGSFAEKHTVRQENAAFEAAKSAVEEAVAILGAVKPPQTDIALMRSAVRKAYQKLLTAVPSLIDLDNQTH